MSRHDDTRYLVDMPGPLAERRRCAIYIAHDYNEIDPDIVWRAAMGHVPQMLDLLTRFLPAEGVAES